MRLTKITIENFRGIQKLELDLEDEITVLIGPNNTGKTAVLEAISFALDPRIRGRASRSKSLETWDFRVNASGSHCSELKFTLEFRERAPNEWSADVVAALGDSVQTDPANLRSVTLRVTGRLAGGLPEEPRFEFLDLQGSVIVKAKDSALRALRQQRPSFYLPALRDAAREFARNAAYWHRFVRDVHITPADRTKVESDIQQVNTDLIAAHKPFTDLRTALAAVGRSVDGNPNADLRFEPLPPRLADLLATTQLSATSPAGVWVPLERHGEGTQSASVLLLFQAYCQTQLAEELESDEAEPIICIEEPESHLHPHAIRALWRTLKSLPGQKIVATHSGDLVAQAFPTHLRRLLPARSPGRIKSTPPLSSKQARAFAYRVRAGRGDLMFAKVWLLGEGETESHMLLGAAEALDLNLEEAGILFVAYRDTGFDAVANVAEDLGIAWFLMPDSDPVQGIRDQNKAKGRPQFGTSGQMEVLPGAGPEEFLWNNGYQATYEAMVPPLKRGGLPAKTDPRYFKAVIEEVEDAYGKPGAAREIAALMIQAKSVPVDLENALKACVAFARSV